MDSLNVLRMEIAKVDAVIVFPEIVSLSDKSAEVEPDNEKNKVVKIIKKRILLIELFTVGF